MKERAQMVRAMETIMRNLNDEDILDSWLVIGVADGDITEDTTDEELEWYCEDKNFSELMDVFVRIMKRATKGDTRAVLYCDGIIN